LTPLAVRVQQACELTGLPRSTLYPKITSGELRSFKIGGARLILYEDLRAWLDRQAADAAPATAAGE
jgi:excisionase family DNA binding protein